MNDLILALLQIIALLETGNEPKQNGEAKGRYQLTPVYVKDVNRIAKTFYTHDDAWNDRAAQQMIYTYLAYYGKKMKERTGRNPTAYDLALIHRFGPFGYMRQDHDYGKRAQNLYDEIVK